MSANRNIFINDGAQEAANAAYTDPSLVPDGKIAWLNNADSSGGSEDPGAATSVTDLLLVRGGDTPQIERILTKYIVDVINQDYRAEVRQQTAIGFSGGADASTINNTEGEASVKFVRLEAGYEQFPRISATHFTKAADTEYDVAADLAEQIRAIDVDKIFGAGTRSFVRADVLSDKTTTQLQDAVPANVTLTVTKDSTRVVASADPVVSVGDTLRIGHATDDTFPVYVVAALDGSTITLDRAYVGDSATGVAAGSGAAPADGDLVGLIVTAEPSDTNGSQNQVHTPAISFASSTDGTLENTNVQSITTPVTSSGSPADVKLIEEQSWGNRGYYSTNYFPQKPASNVKDGDTYDIATIIYENHRNDDGVVSGNNTRVIHLAFDSTDAPTGAADVLTFLGF